MSETNGQFTERLLDLIDTWIMYNTGHVNDYQVIDFIEVLKEYHLKGVVDTSKYNGFPAMALIKNLHKRILAREREVYWDPMSFIVAMKVRNEGKPWSEMYKYVKN